MGNPSSAEVAFFDTLDLAVCHLRGSRLPDWYLSARIEQMLDKHYIVGRDRDDIAARGLFILRQFALMAPDRSRLPARKRAI